MRLLMFSVYDKAVKAYLPPLYGRSRGEILRSFSDACNEEKSNMHLHSSDYTLYYLGEFDDGAGTFHPIDPERVVSANECIVDMFTEEKRSNNSPQVPVKRFPM